MKEDIANTISAGLTSASSLIVGLHPNIPLEYKTLYSSVSPLIQWNLTNLLKSFTSSKKLTEQECIRLGISYNTAIDGINARIQLGHSIRKDSLFEENIFCKAHVILEASIRNTIEDSEYEKSICYGRFMANVPFAEEYSSSALMLLNQIIRQLSYKELCLIACCYKKPAFDCDVIDKYIRNKRDIDASEVFNYFVHMKNLGVFITEPPFVLGSNIGKIRLSFSGESLFELLELNLIPNEDISGLLGTLGRIGVFN